MVNRQRHEAESLHAIQKLNWEWELKDLNMCEANATPTIDETHVPAIPVTDDFDLLP